MECREMVALIHEWLDGDTDEQDNQALQNHLKTCAVCRQHLQELQRVVAFVQSASHVHVSSDFTARVLAQLPSPKKRKLFMIWLRNHPFFTAAAVFLFLMAGSVSASWFDRNDTLQVSSAELDKLVIDRERKVVVVPAGTRIEGDLIVRNGSVEVNGEVNGNVVAIEGKVFVASTAQVVGSTESIEAILDWMWYETKNIGNDLLPILR